MWSRSFEREVRERPLSYTGNPLRLDDEPDDRYDIARAERGSTVRLAREIENQIGEIDSWFTAYSAGGKIPVNYGKLIRRLMKLREHLENLKFDYQGNFIAFVNRAYNAYYDLIFMFEALLPYWINEGYAPQGAELPPLFQSDLCGNRIYFRSRRLLERLGLQGKEEEEEIY